MDLGCWSRSEKTVQESNAAIPTISIAAQLRSKRLKFWMSVCRNSGLAKRLCQSDLQTACGGRPVQQKNWMHQLRTNAAEIFGTVAAAEEWFEDPSLTWPKTNLNSVKPKLLGTRKHHLTCLNPECNRKFVTNLTPLLKYNHFSSQDTIRLMKRSSGGFSNSF